MRPLPLAATALCIAAAAPTAAAGSLYDTTFGNAGDPCFQRTYDAAHLKAHPRQTVSGISLQFTSFNADATTNTADMFELSLSFRLKSGNEWFGGPASCKTQGDHFSCALEGDGGVFTVTPMAGALTLAVINRGGTDAKADQINLEGRDGFAGFGKPAGDDLVFVIPKVANSICSGSGY
ncbi:MAG: hypothetical protein ISS15_02005 [Alphaproteobacteria bacterium]|nr:hypothetical protein [Alphaproteobacteria bacterium]MBL6938346.1 hypothetical protein [Alphaproteobacteria bacterium]MBL7096405.1 hypothetical protein [Alphaproteobacteria bacterium]